MLTKTQLKMTKTKDLERLKARIEAELEERREQEEQQRKQRQEPGAKERLFFSSKDAGHYQWEYRQCGHKERCKLCKSGKRHGPYLYRYLSRDGKYRSEYIKLSELAKHPDAPPRPSA